jgi:SAM-dependent methyltransferase
VRPGDEVRLLPRTAVLAAILTKAYVDQKGRTTMTPPPTRPPAVPVPQRSKRNLVAIAQRAAEAGDLEEAAYAFDKAIEADRRNPELYFQLAMVQEGLEEIDAAVAALTRALSLKPSMLDAGRSLSRLLTRYRITELDGLTAGGLRAALQMPGIALQPIAEVALQHVFQRFAALRDLQQLCGKTPERARTAAAALLRTHAQSLAEPLLLQALAMSVVRAPEIERALAALRAALLLDCPAVRFEDRDITSFALGLLAQGWNNDHAWSVTAEESSALAALKVDRAAISAGDREATRCLILKGLYAPIAVAFGQPMTLADAHQVRPKLVREVIEPRIKSEATEREIAASLPRLRPLTDATSLRVACQYEQSPYPRWQSLMRTQAGQLRTSLGRFVAPASLAFMDVPFDCLIAGAGTGQQVLQSAIAYGDKAQVTALDLSTASLAYATAKAREFSVSNVRFVHGDILDADMLGRQYDIIECIGVLHHMGDPWAGWRTLLRRLKPGGLMYIGLYSAIARTDLAALRAEPGYPGAGCSDAAARAYRAELLSRSDDAPGGEVKLSRNAYALNEFRDLVLHESEMQMTIPEIAEFLDAHKLTFRGFTLPPERIAAFRSAHPDHPLPGRLADWAAFEQANPRTFDAMYCFWCTGPS